MTNEVITFTLTHKCIRCNHEYTPGVGETEDCPSCGCDGRFTWTPESPVQGPLHVKDKVAARRNRIMELESELQRLRKEESDYNTNSDLSTLKEECINLIKTKSTLTAIRHYRDNTGVTILEAKAVIFSLAPEAKQ